MNLAVPKTVLYIKGKNHMTISINVEMDVLKPNIYSNNRMIWNHNRRIFPKCNERFIICVCM